MGKAAKGKRRGEEKRREKARVKSFPSFVFLCSLFLDVCRNAVVPGGCFGCLRKGHGARLGKMHCRSRRERENEEEGSVQRDWFDLRRAASSVGEDV